MQYRSYCSLSETDLARCDIAEVNLAVASGLPGAEGLDISACLARLDDWTSLVRESTERWRPKFVRSPEQFGGSVAQFSIMAMLTVLERDLGVRYNPASMIGPYNAIDSRTHFIHGPLSGFGGTCVSLPVLYLAVGRRLNYPLKLVEAKEHYFVRWQGPDGEQFNIESTAIGFLPRSDDYYRQWPAPISDAELAGGAYLRSFSPRQELAVFVTARGCCLLDNLQIPQAIAAFDAAVRLDRRHGFGLAAATIIAKILNEMRSMENGGGNHFQRLPLAERIELCTPPPGNGLEQKATPLAQAALERIIALHRGSGSIEVTL